MHRTSRLLLRAARGGVFRSANASSLDLAARRMTVAGFAKEMPQGSRHTAGWWGLGAAAIAGAGSVALLQNDNLEPDALQELARDLTSGSSADKERAVSMLSSLTMYVDHHDAILRCPGVLHALLGAITSHDLVPQVRNIALQCTADLMKSPQAHEAALAAPDFTSHLLAALQAKGSWEEGVDQGQAAQAQAARVCAELAGNPSTHSALIKSGLAKQIATQAAVLVHEFGSVAGTYADVSEVPASMDAVSAMEEERFVAAAVFGLAGSKAGAQLLAQHPETLRGVAYWARNSKDPILQRWAVGGLAKILSFAPAAHAQVGQAGGVQALLSALTSSDPQTQCFASAAASSVVSQRDELSRSLAEQGLAPALTSMLQADASGQAGRSEGVQQGVVRCALRCIDASADNSEIAAHFRRAGLGETLQALAAQGHFKSEQLQQLAASAVRKLSG